MNQYYKILDDLDSEGMRKYFSEIFVPRYVDPFMGADRYVGFNSSCIKGKLVDFEKSLEKYNLPRIGYFLVFVHYNDQPIHIDGHTDEIRHVSLNLSVSGHNTTRLKFYEAPDTIEKTKSDATYFPDTQSLIHVDSLITDKWALVNSGVPHNAVNAMPTDRRVTVCFRFDGNPQFKDIISRL